MGFGSGPFGRYPFGRGTWSPEVLAGRLTDFQRQQDDAAGGFFQLFLDALRPTFDRTLVLARDFLDLRDPRKVQTQYSNNLLLRMGQVLEPLSETEQRGQDGTFSSLGEFVSKTARFKASDRGKRLRVLGSALAGNNRTYRIASIVSGTRVIVDPAPVLPDTSMLTWDLRSLIELEPGQTAVEIQEGDITVVARLWTLSPGQKEYTVIGRAQFQRPTKDRVLYTDMEGLDGAVSTTGVFVSVTALFDPKHVGQLLSLGAIPGAQGVYRILSISGTSAPQTVQLGVSDTGAALTLTADPGPFHWALLPRPLLLLEASGPPAGSVEQQGYDLAITVGGTTPTIGSVSMRLVSGRDEGKVFRLVSFGNAANNTLLQVVTIPTSTTATCQVLGDTPVATITATGLYWELRSLTMEGDTTQVRMRPPSFLEFLAADLGLVLDRQDTEQIQRDYVAFATTWMDLKGTVDGYQGLGALLGFNVVAEALYRVGVDTLAILPAGTEVELPETDPGRQGTDGTLSRSGSIVVFSSPTAQFTAGDETRCIRVAGAAVSGNNAVYTIAEYVSRTTVRMRPEDTITLPDANNGALGWQITRFYSTRAPLIPRYDEINIDLMHATVDAQFGSPIFFTVDTYCWEDNFRTYILVNTTAVTQLAPDVWQVEITGAADVVVAVGQWALIVNGETFFLETVPVQTSPGVFTANVQTTTAPDLVTGAQLKYICAPQLTCDYCAASKVRLTISPMPVVGSTPGMVDRYKERLLQKMSEMVPAHVEVVPSWEVDLEARVTVLPRVEVP